MIDSFQAKMAPNRVLGLFYISVPKKKAVKKENNQYVLVCHALVIIKGKNGSA